MYLEHITVAIGDETRRMSVAAIKTGQELHFAISKCHKSDTFTRAKGRKIAEGRIFAGKFIKSIAADDNNKKQFHEEAQKLAIEAMRFKISPSGKSIKAKECKKPITILQSKKAIKFALLKKPSIAQ